MSCSPLTIMKLPSIRTVTAMTAAGTVVSTNVEYGQNASNTQIPAIT